MHCLKPLSVLNFYNIMLFCSGKQSTYILFFNVSATRYFLPDLQYLNCCSVEFFFMSCGYSLESLKSKMAFCFAKHNSLVGLFFTFSKKRVRERETERDRTKTITLKRARWLEFGIRPLHQSCRSVSTFRPNPCNSCLSGCMCVCDRIQLKKAMSNRDKNWYMGFITKL